MQQLVKGRTYGEIAGLHGVSVSTIRTQAMAAYRKLGVHKGAQAVLRMQELGWMVKPKPPPEALVAYRETADERKELVGYLERAAWLADRLSEPAWVRVLEALVQRAREGAGHG
jgi:hypothetical protein